MTLDQRESCMHYQIFFASNLDLNFLKRKITRNKPRNEMKTVFLRNRYLVHVFDKTVQHCQSKRLRAEVKNALRDRHSEKATLVQKCLYTEPKYQLQNWTRH